MTSILFVCHGNICRSPMAQFVMQDLVDKAHLGGRFHIESAAVSSEEIGNPVYPPARQILAEHGISCHGKRARKIEAEDYYDYDIIVAMDRSNMRRLERILPSMDKCRMLLERDVADPWYTGDFEATMKDVEQGCEALLKEVMNG